jgi:hypothetical protein
MGHAKRENVPTKVKVAVEFLIEQKNDLAAAALHAGLSVYELRRALSRPLARRYALAQRQLALQAFCLGSPAALAKVRDTSANGNAVVNAIRAGELLREGAQHETARSEKRLPGLSIVLIDKGGGRVVAYEPHPQPPLLDVTPKPAVPATRPDADERP